MAKIRDVSDLAERLELLERKVNILDTKIEESKRFAFDEIRQVLLRIMSLEASVSKLESKI